MFTWRLNATIRKKKKNLKGKLSGATPYFKVQGRIPSRDRNKGEDEKASPPPPEAPLASAITLSSLPFPRKVSRGLLFCPIKNKHIPVWRFCGLKARIADSVILRGSHVVDAMARTCDAIMLFRAWLLNDSNCSFASLFTPSPLFLCTAIM